MIRVNRSILQLPEQVCEERRYETRMQYLQIQEFKTVSNCNLQLTMTLSHVTTLFHKAKRRHLSAETGRPNYDTHDQIM